MKHSPEAPWVISARLYCFCDYLTILCLTFQFYVTGLDGKTQQRMNDLGDYRGWDVGG